MLILASTTGTKKREKEERLSTSLARRRKKELKKKDVERIKSNHEILLWRERVEQFFSHDCLIKENTLEYYF